MKKANQYYFEFIGTIPKSSITNIYHIVFRYDLLQPGFVLLDLGKEISSESLRENMVRLKNELSQIHQNKIGQKLNYQWMGRFDQQATTKFHRDNAANQSFLMLGYEPSKIESKLSFADYNKLIQKMGISANEYFERFNPMFSESEKLLTPYITEVKPFYNSSNKIVLINNSINTNNKETYGVFHKAEVINVNQNLSRIINSTMMYACEMQEEEKFPVEVQMDFIGTDKISK